MPGPESIVGFKVVRRLGAGGMGEVFEGEDPKLHRRVAIKLMPEAARHDEERRQRFVREARAAAALNHPNVITIFEVGEDSAHGPFLAMELLEGGSLRGRLAEGVVPDAEVLRVAKQIASGLAAAHKVGLVHRDLKPGNVLLAADGTAKVADFGLAKASSVVSAEQAEAPTAQASEVLTEEGMMMGSPGYMAPEQARGEAIDARADVFALGVVLFELCSGRRPFVGNTPMAEVVAAAADDAPDLRELKPEADPALADLIARCVKRNKAERPADASEVLRELEAIGTRSDISPAGSFAAPGVAPRRNFTVPVFVGLLVALLAGLAYFFTTRSGRTSQRAARSTARVSPDSETAPASSGEVARDDTLDAEQYRVQGRAGTQLRGPLLVHCPPTTRCEREGHVAWCDRERARQACCGPGLTPAGDEGLCECPPGGTLRPEAVEAGCAQAERPGIDPALIRATVVAQGDQIQACYEAALDEHPQAQGRVEVRFVVTPRGDIYDVSISATTLPFPQIQRCLLGVLARLQLPPPGGGDPIVVHYPFHLGPR